MRNKVTTTFAVTAVLAVVALGVAAPIHAYACKSQASAKAASHDGMSCTDAAAKAAAAVSIDARDCCKATVAAAVAECTAKASSDCTRSASDKTAGTRCGSANTAAESKTAMKPCCEKTMGAFEVARASYLTTGTMVAGSGAYSCTRGTTGAAASTKIAGSGTYSCSKQVSTKVAQGSSCTKSATSLAAIPYDAGKRVELTGSVVCGHCDLNCTESCQVVFKTADGKVYLLMDSELVEKMRKKTAESGYKVVTVVRDVDGTKYLDVEKMSAL